MDRREAKSYIPRFWHGCELLGNQVNGKYVLTHGAEIHFRINEKQQTAFNTSKTFITVVARLYGKEAYSSVVTPEDFESVLISATEALEKSAYVSMTTYTAALTALEKVRTR
jgi:hypothetical protein